MPKIFPIQVRRLPNDLVADLLRNGAVKLSRRARKARREYHSADMVHRWNYPADMVHRWNYPADMVHRWNYPADMVHRWNYPNGLLLSTNSALVESCRIIVMCKRVA